jgi:hypothetical protein
MMHLFVTSSESPRAIRAANRLLPVMLFAAGLLLRLPGLLFNGQHDLDQIIFAWGTAVKQLGLGAGFQDNYGPFSYALYGLSASLAEQLPRFWWLPYKLIEISLEVGVLVALYELLPKGRKSLALIVYWLNPWFILHGAWQGFWEGPHTLSALLAVLVLIRINRKDLAWAVVGALLMTSAMFKPQGLLHFLLPVALYLIVQLTRRLWSPLTWFSLGSLAVFSATTLLLVVTGGSFLSIPRNYLTATTIMPNLCNGCLNGWRTVSTLLQAITRQTGPTYLLQLPPLVSALLQWTALIIILILLFKFFTRIPLEAVQDSNLPAGRLTSIIFVAGLAGALIAVLEWIVPAEAERTKWLFNGVLMNYRLILVFLLVTGLTVALTAPIVSRSLREMWRRLAPWQGKADRPGLSPALSLYLVLVTASLLLAQFGTRSHINHTYAALTLLIPFALSNRRALASWIIMIGVNFYGHLASYGLGRSLVMPQSFGDALTAQPLVAQIRQVIEVTPSDVWLRWQSGANQLLSTLPKEPLISVLAAVQFICTLVILKELWAFTAQPVVGAVIDADN